MRVSTASTPSTPRASLTVPVVAPTSPQAVDDLPPARVSPAAVANAAPDENVPAGHLSLFASPLLAASQLSPLRSQQRPRRSRRASVAVREQKAPSSLRLQPFPPSSPFCMLEPVSYLSLLPADNGRAPCASSSAASAGSASASDAPLPGAESFLYPLSHLSSVGLTVSPPGLNWSAASRELDTAAAASSALLSAACSCQAERLQQLDRLVSVSIAQDVDALAQQPERARLKRWDEQERASWELSAARRQQREQVVSSQSASCRQQAAESRSRSERLAADEWRFRDESEDAERAQRESRAARQTAQTVAAERLDRRREAESQQWQREWRLQAEASRLQRVREREERVRRQQEVAQRADAKYEALRLKAKGARLQLRIARVELLDGRVVPAWAAPFICCQVVQQPPAAAVLEYPSPLTELQFSPFITAADGLLDWRCELVVRSVAHASLVLSYQCCEQAQATRWQRWLAKRDVKTATSKESREEANEKQLSGDRLPAAVRSPASLQGEQRRSAGSTNRNASSRAADGESGQQATSRRRRAQAAASSRPQSHRHRLITRTLELARLEWGLRELRDAGGGELRAMASMSGEAWYARRERQDRKRRKSITPRPPQLLSPRSTADETADPLHHLFSSGPLSPSSLNARNLLQQSPSSLFPPPHRPKRSALQLLLMTEKERVEWVEEDQRKELLRREKERRERDKFTRHIANVWIHICMTPCDADGADITREGHSQPADSSSATQAEGADDEEDDDGEGEEDEGEEPEEQQQVDAEVERLWREEERWLRTEHPPSSQEAESRARLERAARREQERRQQEATRRAVREGLAGQAAVKGKTFPLLQ